MPAGSWVRMAFIISPLPVPPVAHRQVILPNGPGVRLRGLLAAPRSSPGRPARPPRVARARARPARERPVGRGPPVPLPDPAEWISSRPGAPADPADRITLDESVSMAFLVVLESMTPAERVAFILHDVFHYPFTEVAEIVGRTPAACRQLASSARRRIRAPHAATPPTGQQAGLVRHF